MASAIAKTATRGGVELLVRPIEAHDRDRLARAFQKLSETTRFRRFLAPKLALSDRELTEFTELDHHEREALIALDPEDELVGVARYIALDQRPQVAEVAVTVADDWQHQGVGTALLSQLIGRAEDEGFKTFVATCLVDNSDMISLFRELGDSVTKTGGGAGAIELEIALPTDAHHQVRPALRAVAATPSLTAAPSAPRFRSDYGGGRVVVPDDRGTRRA